MTYLIGIGIGIVSVLSVQWALRVALRMSLERQELERYRREDEYLKKEEELEDAGVDVEWLESLVERNIERGIDGRFLKN